MSAPKLRVITSTEPMLAVDPGRMGYHVVYRRHETNYCPGCGRVSWWIGRAMAQCAFCETAIDLEKPR